MVNGVAQSQAVDALFQAAVVTPGRIPDTAAELAELDIGTILHGPLGPRGSDAARKARQHKPSAEIATLLPPDCQGAACHARAALAALAAACAADRGCRQLLGIQETGQVKLSGPAPQPGA